MSDGVERGGEESVRLYSELGEVVPIQLLMTPSWYNCSGCDRGVVGGGGRGLGRRPSKKRLAR